MHHKAAQQSHGRREGSTQGTQGVPVASYADDLLALTCGTPPQKTQTSNKVKLSQI